MRGQSGFCSRNWTISANVAPESFVISLYQRTNLAAAGSEMRKRWRMAWGQFLRSASLSASVSASMSALDNKAEATGSAFGGWRLAAVCFFFLDFLDAVFFLAAGLATGLAVLASATLANPESSGAGRPATSMQAMHDANVRVRPDRARGRRRAMSWCGGVTPASSGNWNNPFPKGSRIESDYEILLA